MTITNLPGGLSPFLNHTLLGDLPWPMPLDVTAFFQDFHRFDDSEGWDADSGNFTGVANIAGNGGLIQIGTTATASNTGYIVLSNLNEVDSFEVSGRRNWFSTRLQPDENTNINWATGLQTYAATTAPTDTASVTNGVWFHHNSGSSDIEFIVKSPSGTTTVPLISDYDPSDFVTLTWRLGRNGTFEATVDSELFIIPTTNLPTVSLQLKMGAQTTENVNHFINIDYVLAASDR